MKRDDEGDVGNEDDPEEEGEEEGEEEEEERKRGGARCDEEDETCGAVVGQGRPRCDRVRLPLVGTVMTKASQVGAEAPPSNDEAEAPPSNDLNSHRGSSAKAASTAASRTAAVAAEIETQLAFEMARASGARELRTRVARE